MKGKSVALLVLALGCGLVASIGITQVLSKRGDEPASADTVAVFVARSDIATGSRVTAENTKLVQMAKDNVPTGAVVRKEDLDDRRTRQKIFAGEPILDPKLFARGEVATEGLIPKGLRVVPIQVGLEAIHSGLVLPGSRCDVQVFIRANPGLGFNDTVCKTILQDIRVFAVNDVVSTENPDPRAPETRSIPAGKTVSLLVTPAQAQVVTLAGQLGTILLIMRSGEDRDQLKTREMAAHELMGSSGGADRAKEDPNEANEKRFKEWADAIRKTLRENAQVDPNKPKPLEATERFTIRVRMGTEVNDVLLVKNSGVQSLADEGAWTATGLGPPLHARAQADPQPSRSAETAPAATPPSAAAQPKVQPDSQLPPTRPGYSPPVGA